MLRGLGRGEAAQAGFGEGQGGRLDGGFRDGEEGLRQRPGPEELQRWTQVEGGQVGQQLCVS